MVWFLIYRLLRPVCSRRPTLASSLPGSKGDKQKPTQIHVWWQKPRKVYLPQIILINGQSNLVKLVLDRWRHCMLLVLPYIFYEGQVSQPLYLHLHDPCLIPILLSASVEMFISTRFICKVCPPTFCFLLSLSYYLILNF